MLPPKLRPVDKTMPPYPLGGFPKNVIDRIGAEIVYLLATRDEARLEGQDWERIFAYAIEAEWTPSNIGLDDIRLGNCCWGAKTVKNGNPSRANRVRLISGRNSPDYSYNQSDPRGLPADDVGQMVIGIWNERVSGVRQRFKNCRSVVLIKSDDLSECVIFEFETLRYEAERFTWKWNNNKNLEGYDENNLHRFTWQPHGSQFTIIEDVPSNRIAFQIRKPSIIPKEVILKTLGFDRSWITIL